MLTFTVVIIIRKGIFQNKREDCICFVTKRRVLVRGREEGNSRRSGISRH